MFAEQRAAEVAVRAGRWAGRGGRQAGRSCWEQERHQAVAISTRPKSVRVTEESLKGFQFSPEYREDLSETLFFSLDMYGNQAGIRVYSRHT